MKRYLLLAAALLPVAMASCSRQSFLKVVLEKESAETPAVIPEEAIEGWESVAAEPRELTPHEQLQAVWDELQMLREETAADPAADPAQLDDLILRLDKLDATLTAATDQQSLHEARLAALETGAAAQLPRYAEMRDEFCRARSGRSYNRQVLEQAAIQRFVIDHLSRPRTDEATLTALSRHITCYPHCEMNVEFYTATVERLVNEQRIGEAADLARDGLRRCAAHDDVAMLEERLHQIYAEHPGAPGTPMQFKSRTLRRSRFDLKSLRGRPVLVTFWATWCPACVEEMPKLKQIHERYRDQQLEVVSISLDSDRQALAEFVSQHNLPWPQMFSQRANSAGGHHPIAQRYGVHSIPSVFLIDAEAIIVAADMGTHRQIETAVRNHLE